MVHLFRGLAGDSSSQIRKAAEAASVLSEAERLLILSWNTQLDSRVLKAAEQTEQAVRLLSADARLQ